MRVGSLTIPQQGGLRSAQPSGTEGKMHVNSATTEAACTGVEDVFRDQVWRLARIGCPNLVLNYDPRLADLGCLDCLEEAEFFARERILWIVERRGVLVATMRRSNDKYEAVFWKQPELIEIASCQPAWQLLPTWLQEPIWRRLLSFIRGNSPVPHDRPEIRRLAEKTFRARVDRAIEQRNDKLVMELAKDSPFWGMNRGMMLQQHPVELRRWCRLLRLPRGEASEFAISDFVRALHHAAGLIVATFEENDS
jgi:hypothetical protein